MSDDAIAEVTDATFETDVLESDPPVIVEFGADWCGPCRAIADLVADLAETHADAIRVVHVDVDDNPQTPSNYGIKSIPTVLRFDDGNVVDRVVGAVPRPRLERLFSEDG
ncbi:MAG: thioredoxin family protein [Bradymonadaceae bacterium]